MIFPRAALGDRTNVAWNKKKYAFRKASHEASTDRSALSKHVLMAIALGGATEATFTNSQGWADYCLHRANERRRYFVTPSLIGWVQA